MTFKALFGSGIKKRSSAPGPASLKTDTSTTLPEYNNLNDDPTLQTLGSMRNTLNTLTKRQEFLQTKISQEVKKAIDFKKLNNTNAALTCLKRKKLFESEVDKLTGAMFNLETQMITLESSQTTSAVISTQKEYAKVMKDMTKNVNVDDVATLQDEIQEQMDVNNELNEILGESNPLHDTDTYELENELDAILKEDENVKFDNEDVSRVQQPTNVSNTDEEAELEDDLNKLLGLDVPTNRPKVAQPKSVVADLPKAPTNRPVVQRQDAKKEEEAEEDEDMKALRELTAEMAM